MLKEKLNNQLPVLGTMISEFAQPNLVRMMKTAGFEMMILDCEHGYFDFSQIAAIASLGNGFEMPILVRIPEIRREVITRALDMSCDGIIAPMVNTVEEAEALVQYAKYQPLGARGLSITRVHAGYNPGSIPAYLEQANNRTCLLVQLETRQAIERAKDIAAIEGIDALMIGPNDLAADFKTPGQVETDEMFWAISAVIQAAKEAGKSCGIIASSPAYLKKCQAMGMNVFSLGSELGMLLKGAKDSVEAFYEI